MLTDGSENMRLSQGSCVANPADLFALESALRIKDSFPETRVSVLTMGPLNAKDLLKSCIAMGADTAVLLTDVNLAGADTVCTSRALAGVITSLRNYDLILCGNKALDSETGNIGPQLSYLLGMEYLNNASEILFDGHALKVRCSNGLKMMEYMVKLPIAVGITALDGTVRLPTISGIRRSQKEEITILSAADIGFDPSGKTHTDTIALTKEYFALRNGKYMQGDESLCETVGMIEKVLCRREK